MIVNMILILIAEVFQGSQYRVRGSLPKSAHSAVLDLCCQLFQKFDISVTALAFCDSFQNLQHSLSTDTAVVTFTAGFFLCKVKEETSHIYHTGVLIHNDHTAGTNDSTCFIDIFICNRSIDQLCRDTSAGWSAHLNSFEFLVVFDSSANVVNNLFQSHSHRNFYKAALFDLTCKGKYFGSFGLLGTSVSKCLTAVCNDPCNVCISFYVINVGRKLPVSLCSRERRFQTRHTSLTFQRSDQSGLLTTYECTCTSFDADIKVEICSKQILS